MIRQLACKIRGDASTDVLSLAQMPSISVDLPKTKHGYDVVAEEVFWVSQGVLRSTELRDSLDEQCLADISASILYGQPIERSKDALDAVYQPDSVENLRLIKALDAYGSERLETELMYCIDELLKVCEASPAKKLRGIIFSKPSTNPFPAAFAILMLALHESLIGGEKLIADYGGVKNALTGLYSRIETSRRSTAPDERRKNIDTVKGLIAPYLMDGKAKEIYGAHSTMDIDAAIRRSEIELPHYELKQGLLTLDSERSVDGRLIEKVVRTICAIANNGKDRSGKILIGVTDKDADAERVCRLDNIEPRKVGKRNVVGVKREADHLGESPEQYFARWKHAIRSSRLSQPLRDSVLSIN